MNNHTLFGIHLVGNEGTLDTQGYIATEQNKEEIMGLRLP
jgi:hypothetical protein